LFLEQLENRTLPSGTVSLLPGETAPQPVGDPVTWTATASDCGDAPVYQFSVAPHEGAFRVVRDFSPSNTFAWTLMQEGTYDVRVIVKDGYEATETTTAEVPDEVVSRVTGSQAVISPTPHPLVALYSVPPTREAGTVFVQFAEAGDKPSWRNTNALAVVPGVSTNVFVAGMLPNTTYQMRHVFSDGTASAPLLFTTGSLPTNLVFPTFTVRQSPGPGSDLDQDLIFHVHVNSPTESPLTTDLRGRVEWYFDVPRSGLTSALLGSTLVPGGTVLMLGSDPYRPLPGSENVLREIDLAGNAVRETNIDAVNAQLTALGHDIIHGFTQDVQRLPGGATVVLSLTERTVPINGIPTNYVGIMIVALDEDFQVAWAWDAFDHLDVDRGPVLGEVLQPGSADPTSAVPNLPAVDWLHANGLSWSPTDGNLVLSVRHQDWVVKIDYRSGEGDGHIIWRLGQDGDFTVHSTHPYPWFSHQHNPHYIDDSTLILFDNGNTRRAGDPDAPSRGQVWQLDEQTMTATPLVNVDLGRYSSAVGAAQRLSNGDFSFTAGNQGLPPNQFGQTIEVRPDGTLAYVLEINKQEYRSFRVRTLYEGTGDALAGALRQVESFLNDGSAQRSMITRITVSFDGAVLLDPGAIELRRQDGGLVNLHLAVSGLDSQTVAVLTFAGSEFAGGSLPDGHYILTIHSGLVHDRFGHALDGTGTGVEGSDRTDSFFRLFGDADGDGRVDLRDLLRLGSTLGKKAGEPGYLWYFDYDGDGRVGLGDLLQLLRRLGG
jgi:hypothetical protein